MSPARERDAAGGENLATGDLSRLLTARLATAKATLRQAQEVSAREIAALQTEVAQIEAAIAALTTDREAFILQLQAAKIL